MALRVSCPSCSTKISLPDSVQGKSVKVTCKKCSTAFSVKAPTALTPKPIVAGNDFDFGGSSAARSPRRPQKEGSNWLLIGGIGAGAIAILAVVLILALGKSDDQPTRIAKVPPGATPPVVIPKENKPSVKPEEKPPVLDQKPKKPVSDPVEPEKPPIVKQPVVKPDPKQVSAPTKPAPGSDKTERRTNWVHRVGGFAQVKDKNWIESWQRHRNPWKETARTDEYIELRDDSRKSTIRLYEDRCELKRDKPGSIYKKIYTGKWKTEVVSKPKDPMPSKPKDPVVSKPKDPVEDNRKQWTHSTGHFAMTGRKKWVEVGKRAPRYFVEKKRTEDYIELSDGRGIVTLRLYADRCESRNRRINPFKKLYDGNWGTKVVAGPGAKTYTGKAKDRDYWTYPDGHFEKGEKKTWWQFHKGEPKVEWMEYRRTDSHVDLRSRDSKKLILLYADKCQAIRPVAQLLYKGHWGLEAPPSKVYVATGKPEDRDYWSFAEGHFEKIAAEKWIKVTSTRKHEYLEKPGKGTTVMLYDPGLKVTLYLTETRCMQVKRIFGKLQTKEIHRGQWGKVVAAKPLPRANAQWVSSLLKMKFPKGMVAGKLAGREFHPDKVIFEINTGKLIFAWAANWKKSLLPDLAIEMKATLIGPRKWPFKIGTAPEGMVFRRPFGQASRPFGFFINARARNNQGGLDVRGFGDVSYVLEFGKRQGDILPGRIYICTLDKERSFLAGSFKAVIKR